MKELNSLCYLSESLKELMNEHNLNQAELAKNLNTGRTKFSLILNGKSAPNFNTFVSIIEYFNCSADFLLGLKDYPCEETEYKPVQPFNERLRSILKETGTSQYLFIKQSKISWGVFYNWLVGKSKPSIDNLVRIAKYFDCSVDFLLGRV